MARQAKHPERVRTLIVLDAGSIMKRLEERKAEMIALFSRHRDREPLLNPLRSMVAAADSFEELALFQPEQQKAIHGFYEELDSLRWYFRYTTDMPGTAERVFLSHRKRLVEAFERLLAHVGAPAEGAGIEPPPELRSKALPATRKRRRRAKG
jgi:pimeloyl-ACP methyl ester carboxylesterase